MTPTVACVLVTYNHERWVGEALDSILAQDEPHGRIRLAVVDNGSTDATPEILREYEDRATVLRIQPRPINAAFNLGFEHVDGDYLTVFSGDDVWTPGRLDHMIGVMEGDPDLGLLYGDMEIVDGEGRTRHPSMVRQSRLRLPAGPPLGELMKRNLVFGPALLIRGSLRRAVLPIPPQASWEDWWFATAVARVAAVAHTPEVVARYRRHGANVTEVKTDAQWIPILRDEVRFRGWMLRTAAAGDATAAELLRAAAQQAEQAGRLSTLEERTGTPAAAPFDPARAQACAAAAAEAADPVERMVLYANAVGHDAADPVLRERLARAVAVVEDARADRVHAYVSPRTVVEDARSHVTLAFADELLASPELLRRYAAEVPPDADATLAILAPEADPADLAQPLVGGLAEPLPDMVLVTVPATPAVQAALAVRARDVLAASPPAEWPFAGLPRF